MHARLLDYYNQELVYMRELGAEFAATHPKIASRLALQDHEIGDPDVERLLESFSFMAARMRIKLDAEFPRFMQRLLEVLHPNYLCPIPSMAVAQLHPRCDVGDFTRGVVVPRGTPLHARVGPGQETPCEFRSSQAVTLWPLEIVSAEMTGPPSDLPMPLPRRSPTVEIRAALRLRLRTHAAEGFRALIGLDRLPIFVRADAPIATGLLELLHTATAATMTRATGLRDGAPHLVQQDAVRHEGLDPGESLLPVDWQSFHGHTLVQEYFACPERFHFFSLVQLAPGLARLAGHEAEITVLLTRPAGTLEGRIDASHFALHCTPIVNLFERAIDRIEVDPARPDFHLVPDRSRPLDFEVHTVRHLVARERPDSVGVEFRPLYQTLHGDGANHGRYFSLQRDVRVDSDTTRRHGARSDYRGSEAYLSLVDQRQPPFREELRFMSVQAVLSNRDLAVAVPRNGRDDLAVAGSLPVTSIGLVTAPTAPRPPHGEHERAWRLVRHLGYHHLPLADLPEAEGARVLREMLRLHVPDAAQAQHREIDSLVGSRIETSTRRLPGAGPLVYGRGVTCTLRFDERGLSGISPYLLGLVLERYIARHVSINLHTQLALESVQRGVLMRWPLRAGGRGSC